MNKQLAKITKASLEIKERGILGFWIWVDYEEGGSQGIGGIALDSWDKKKEKRVGTAYGCEMIRSLLLCLGVNDFSEMEGKMIWVLGESKGLSFNPKGIERLNLDKGDSESKSVVFDDIFKEMTEGESK